MRELIERERIQEDDRSEMVMRVDIQETLNRLEVCPACGRELYQYPTNDLARSCEVQCGEFVITGVYTNGDVEFKFTLKSAEKEEVAVSDDDGSVHAVPDRQL